MRERAPVRAQSASARTLAPFCQKGQASYFICRACELIFQHPLPTEAAMRTWADEEYTSGAYQRLRRGRADEDSAFRGPFRGHRRSSSGRAACSTSAVPAGTSWRSPRPAASTCRAWSSREARSPPPSPAIRSRDLRRHAREPARERSLRRRQRVRPDRARARSHGLSPSLRRTAEARRHARDQHARHGALSSIPDAIALADAAADAASVLFSRRALAAALRAEGFADVTVDTAYKTLSVDYLINQIKPLNPRALRNARRRWRASCPHRVLRTIPAHQHRRDPRRRAGGPDTMPRVSARSISRPARGDRSRPSAQCRICRSTDLSYEFIVDGCPVCRCAHCSLLFLNPQPGRTEARLGPAAAPPMQSSVYELHAANAASRLDQLMGYAGPGLRRVLMIANDASSRTKPDGAGSRSSRCRALEVDGRRSRDAARRSAFDAAIFYCTLERLTDPDAVLKDLKRRLTPSGVVMVIAPTIDSRTARLFRSAWWEFNAAESALLLGRHAPEPAAQERIRRSDHRRRRQRGVARVFPREDSGGVVRRVPPRV